MDVCGIDFSTKAIDVVRLSIDSDEATWRCLELDAGKGDALERCRLIRGVMPARGTWKDEGVLGVALERPAGASRIGVAQLMRVQGAILACLPRGLLVTELHPAEWKQRSVGRGNASKEDVARWAFERWQAAGVSQDAYDAYCMAWALRSMIAEERGAAVA